MCAQVMKCKWFMVKPDRATGRQNRLACILVRRDEDAAHLQLVTRWLAGPNLPQRLDPVDRRRLVGIGTHGAGRHLASQTAVAIVHGTQVPVPILTQSLRRLQPEINPLTHRLRVTCRHGEAWHMTRILQPGDGGLGGPHARRELRLSQTGLMPGLNQFPDQRKDRATPVILGLELGGSRHARLQGVKVRHRPTSFA
jgi:hypothetical protein